MGYRETAVPEPKPQLIIDGADYDLDWFGMDDGRDEDPDTALRFIFQLGRGYMIYLYVVQAGGRTSPHHFFHTFWLKDCAVAEVEMEDLGPPSEVRVETVALPLHYSHVTLGEKRYAVSAQRFSAPSASELRMELDLDAGAQLRWTRADGWMLLEGARRRVLEPGEFPRFDPPGED